MLALAPDRQPRRDRRAASPARRGASASRRSRSPPTPTATRRTRAWPTRPSRSAARRRRVVPAHRQDRRRGARDAGADAIHPGYGFLSENAAFARRRASTPGCVWIGPPPERDAGDGRQVGGARRMARAPAFRSLPGYDGARSATQRRCAPKRRGIGFPLMVKAAAGGGGRGMRLVRDATPSSPPRCALGGAEAQAAFGDARLLLERAVARRAPRRDPGLRRRARQRASTSASATARVQRRHQKLIEEAPSPAV